MTPTCLADPVAVLGEAPLWDVDLARLFWVDCDQKLLFELDPATGVVTRTELPHFPGSYAIRGQGGMVMAYRNGIVLSEGGWDDAHPVATPGVDFTAERFNDGTCDRAGRFWVGTMDRRLRGSRRCSCCRSPRPLSCGLTRCTPMGDWPRRYKPSIA